MALVRRPYRVICTFRGNEVILQNNEPTADSERFEQDAKDFAEFLEGAWMYKDLRDG